MPFNAKNANRKYSTIMDIPARNLITTCRALFLIISGSQALYVWRDILTTMGGRNLCFDDDLRVALIFTEMEREVLPWQVLLVFWKVYP